MPARIAIIAELMTELATELDLHYEDHEMLVLQPSIEVLNRGAQALRAADVELPEEVAHILGRYKRAGG